MRQDIIAAPLAEIDLMHTWLCQWYDRCAGRPGGTARAERCRDRETTSHFDGVFRPGSATPRGHGSKATASSDRD